jgi:transposase
MIATGRCNWMFTDSDTGGVRVAATFTLVETAKLNGFDPQAYLQDVLAFVADHSINCIGNMLP